MKHGDEARWFFSQFLLGYREEAGLARCSSPSLVAPHEGTSSEVSQELPDHPRAGNHHR